MTELLLAATIALAPLPAKKPWTLEQKIKWCQEWDATLPAPKTVPKPDLPE